MLRLISRACALATGTCLALLSISVAASSLSVSSSTQQIKLVELYTSEGCSSCPPADRWVSKLRRDPGLWRTFIPMAFHVDYWDYIGWPDKFASPAFTARQHTYAAQESMSVVYTPGFFVNGKEWRWRRQNLDDYPASDSAGILSLNVDGRKAVVQFDHTETNQDYSANIALLGFGIETEVGAGENNGRTLTHDFVVLAVERRNLASTGKTYSTTLSVPESGITAERYALVAWIDRPGDQTPLQAVGGFL